MVRQRTARPTMTTIMTNSSALTLTMEDDPAFSELRSSLAEINKIPGVKGYILRNVSTAVIDLKDPAKLIEYALLLAETIDTSQEISELFSMNTPKAVLEGKDLKMLCMVIGENRLCVFIEKSMDHAEIFRRISL